MDKEVEVRSAGWRSTEAYGLAAVCLGAGLVFGYLLHGPSKATTGVRVEAASQAEAQPAAAMPSPEHIKQMGDKMAEPLLKDLKSNENNAETLAKLASVYFRSGQYPLAIEYFEKSLKAKPSVDGYVALSNTYHYTGDDEKAIKALNQALAIDPKSANALFNLGMLDWKVKKDPKAAVEAWQQLLKANPKHPKRAQVESLIAKVQSSE
jgi:tetratricopeptide (TPR) repeat protein